MKVVSKFLKKKKKQKHVNKLPFVFYLPYYDVTMINILKFTSIFIHMHKDLSWQLQNAFLVGVMEN